MSFHRKKCNCNCGQKQKTFKPGIKKSVNIMNNPLSMVKSFAMSVASRGLKNNKADIAVKQLRTLSCFGDKMIGGQLESCEHLSQSKTKGKYYCAGCGCGDRKATWLQSNGDDYSKLDYPTLTCPLKMPGFSNYKSGDEESNNRKVVIENYDMKNLARIKVSAPPKA